MKPKLLLKSLCLACCASFVTIAIVTRFGNTSWDNLSDSLRHAPMLVRASTSSSILVPLNVAELQRNFPDVKKAVDKHLSHEMRRNFNRLMIEYVPVLDTRTWLLHTPSGGRNFTVRELQEEFLATIQPEFVVPNVAHIILPFFDTHLKFYHMVCILSCIHVMKPHRLMLWYAPGRLPTGEWWNRLRKNLTDTEWEEKIIMARRPIPREIYSRSVNVREHQSDVMRMEALLTFGGFYMDLDVVVLKPLDPLRKYQCTIGRETGHGLCNGALLSAPNSTFLAMWYTAYQAFEDAKWSEHSVLLPHTMQSLFPKLCHVEEDSMDRPNWTGEEVQWIFAAGEQKHWDWRAKNYVMHLWFDKYGLHDTMETIRTLNSTYGDICRFILFGN